MTGLRRWDDLTTEDFARLDPARTVAILPLAATEQHGPHLPLSVDAAISEAIVGRAATNLPAGVTVLALPLQRVGISPEHAAYPGTLTVEPETAIALWTEIGRSVARAGLRKLLLFNSHGGNAPALELVARRLRADCGLFVAFTSWQRFGLPPGLFPEDEIRYGIHGGALETAIMLHARPDLVRADKIAAFASSEEAMARDHRWLTATGRIGFGWLSGDLNPTGAVGDATLADAEKGRLLVEHAARGLAELMAEIASHGPADTA